MHSRVERLIGHNGTETRPSTPTGGSSRESSTMGASLMEQHRVSEEGFRLVNSVVKEERV